MSSRVAGFAVALGVLAWAGLQGTALGQGCTDGDGDGVCDAEDNCVALFQPPTQRCDTDQDGYGNMCDGDFNNDNTYAAGSEDLLFFGMHFGDQGALVTDMNCDQVTGVPDWGILNQPPNASPPGPSGLACAGTIPCP
jgi:hypothetical protein